MYSQKGLLFTIIVLSIIWVGCSGEKKPAGFPKIYPCSIIVTQENEPLANASVILFSESEEYARWSISGSTDNSGVAIITTEGKFVGAPVGKFKVLVSKSEAEKKETKNPNSNERDFIIGDNFSYVPANFGDREKTTLTAEVVKGKNEIKLDLGKKVKIKL